MRQVRPSATLRVCVCVCEGYREGSKPAKSVFVLLGPDESDVLAIHRTRTGADAHRANYVMPSWVTIDEWTLDV